MKSKFMLAGVAALATAGVLSMTATSAQADPSSFKTYQAVGSDTIQDVWNNLANTGALSADDVASYDAFGSSTIQTRSGGVFWKRPAGSGDGVKFLSAAYNGGTWPGASTAAGTLTNQSVPQTDVAFARSSSGPVSGSGLTYIPFSRDAVSLAFHTTTGLTSLNINTAQLTELYSGVNNTADDTAGYPTVTITGSGASAVATIGGVTVHPQIPQQGSGTRKFFLGAIGVSSLAAYISDPATGGLAENSGASIPNAGDLIPFSAAQWISQVKGTQTSTIGSPAPTGFAIASVNGLTATTGSGASTAPGSLFGHTTSSKYDVVPGTGVDASNPFERDTYNVIPTSFKTGTASQQALYSLLGNASDDLGLSGQATIGSYGFGQLSYFGDSTKELSGAWQ